MNASVTLYVVDQNGNVVKSAHQPGWVKSINLANQKRLLQQAFAEQDELYLDDSNVAKDAATEFGSNA